MNDEEPDTPNDVAEIPNTRLPINENENASTAPASTRPKRAAAFEAKDKIKAVTTYEDDL